VKLERFFRAALLEDLTDAGRLGARPEFEDVVAGRANL
jgi:hypothetical protein